MIRVKYNYLVLVRMYIVCSGNILASHLYDHMFKSSSLPLVGKLVVVGQGQVIYSVGAVFMNNT